MYNEHVHVPVRVHVSAPTSTFVRSLVRWCYSFLKVSFIVVCRVMRHTLQRFVRCYTITGDIPSDGGEKQRLDGELTIAGNAEDVYPDS